MPTIPERSYTEEAAAFDGLLDERIGEIRARQDAGLITVREAADLRVDALVHHLAVLKALRQEFFPDEDDE